MVTTDLRLEIILYFSGRYYLNLNWSIVCVNFLKQFQQDNVLLLPWLNLYTGENFWPVLVCLIQTDMQQVLANTNFFI